MTDKETIDRTAKVWVECGGDAEGITYCWRTLRDRVAELKAEPLDLGTGMCKVIDSL